MIAARPGPKPDRRRAFTFAELLATMTVITVIAVAVAPVFDDNERLQIRAAAEILASDIELAKVMTMSDPRDPVAVGFGGTGTSYWLSKKSMATPIVRPDTGETYLVTLGSGRAAAAADVVMSVSGLGGGDLEFDEHGALLDFTTTPIIRLRLNDEWIDLSISPTTGSITETWGEDDDEDEAAEVR